ncbi:LysM peptidoglycan-binding domain-containing protein [Hoeflea sp. CAU 1731]
MTNNKSRFWSILALLVIVVGIGYLLRFDPYGWQEKPEVQQATDEEVVVEETVSNDNGVDAEVETVAKQSGVDDVDDAAATQKETADIAPQGGVPTFSLLRVEPDGSTVVAGSAAPGVMLEVFSGDTVLAETEVGPSGDFVTVFDDPLPPGDYEIGLRSRGDADMVMLSEEIATVSVPEEDSRELMVMVTKPGEPSRLLDQPEAVADAGGDENLQSDDRTAESEETSDAAGKEMAAAETSSEPAGETVATSETGATAQDTEPAAATEEVTTAAADEETSSGETIQVASALETSNEPDTASESAMTSADSVSTNQKETSELASTEGQSTASATDTGTTQTAADAATEVADAEPAKGAAQDKPVATVMVEKTDDKVETAAAAPEATASREADEGVKSTGTARHAVVNEDSASTEKQTAEPLRTAAMTEKSEAAPEPEGSAEAAPTEDTAEATTDPEPGETTEVASLDTGKSQRPAVSADIRVRIDAVEIENGQLFVAGSGTPGGKVIVFADNDAVGESMISATGRFLVEAQKELSVGDHTIRADLYLPNGSAAAIRVAVPFNRPEGNMVAAVAPQPKADGEAVTDKEDKAMSGAGPEGDQSTSEGSTDQAVVVKAPAANTTSETESEPKSTGTMAKTDDKPTETQTEMKSDADQKTVAEQDSAAPAVEPGEEPAVTNVPKTTEPVEEKVAAVAEPKPGPETKEVAVAGEEGEPPTVVQPPLEQRDSSVIIRRGDTLWQISRRVYGRGVRYTTIYLANTDQIRNPDFIEPGQTFMVPEKPLPNAEQLHRDRLLKR